MAFTHLPSDTRIQKFLIKLISTFDNFSRTRTLAMLSVIPVLIGGGYAVTQATLSQASTADQFASTYISADAAKNGSSIIFLAQHTNLFKLPVLALQGIMPYNKFSWVLLNILFVVATILLWSYLLKKVTGRISTFSISNLLLASILMASTELSIALSMTTQRHLDYVLLFLFFYLVFKYRLRTLKSFIGASATLAILVASDYFFLTLVPVTVLIVIGLELFTSRSKIKPYRETMKLMSSSLVGVVGGIALIQILVGIGVIALFGSDSRLNVIGKLTPSAESIFAQLLTLLTQITELLGANIFSVPFSKSLLLAMPFLLFTLLGAAMMWKSIRHARPSNFDTIFIVFLGLTYLAYITNSLAHPGDAYIRFISITPFVFVSAVILSPAIKKHMGLLLLFSFVLLAAGALRLIPNQSVYTAKQIESQRWVHTNKLVLGVLEDKGIKTAYGTIGWSSTSWFYSKKQVDVYNILPCNVRGAALSTTAWYKDHATQTAIIRDNSFPMYAKGESWHECDDVRMRSIYGDAKDVITINDAGKKIDILLYDYDVSTKFTDYNSSNKPR